MEDWLLFIQGALGVQDMVVLVQVPTGKWAKEMIEALCYGGLKSMFNLDDPQSNIESISVTRHLEAFVKKHRAHFLVSVQGIKLKGVYVNDFFVYLQLPAPKGALLQECAESMVMGPGLGFWLGKFCKKITWHRAGQTGADLWEPLSTSIIVS